MTNVSREWRTSRKIVTTSYLKRTPHILRTKQGTIVFQEEWFIKTPMVNHNTFLSRFTLHLFQRGFFLLQEKFRRTSTFLCIKPARTTNLRRMHCPGKKSSLPVVTFCWLPLVVVSLKVESFDSCARERKCRFCKLTVCC